jgi:hypothetical protein
MHNEVVYAINLMKPYKLSHPTLVGAWTIVLRYLECREEPDILRDYLDQLYNNLHNLDDMKDLTLKQVCLLLVIST